MYLSKLSAFWFSICRAGSTQVLQSCVEPNLAQPEPSEGTQSCALIASGRISEALRGYTYPPAAIVGFKMPSRGKKEEKATSGFLEDGTSPALRMTFKSIKTSLAVFLQKQEVAFFCLYETFWNPQRPWVNLCCLCCFRKSSRGNQSPPLVTFRGFKRAPNHRFAYPQFLVSVGWWWTRKRSPTDTEAPPVLTLWITPSPASPYSRINVS